MSSFGELSDHASEKDFHRLAIIGIALSQGVTTISQRDRTSCQQGELCSARSARDLKTAVAIIEALYR